MPSLNAARRGRRSPSFAVDEETGEAAVTGLRSTGFLTISASRPIGRCRNDAAVKNDRGLGAPRSLRRTRARNAGDGLRSASSFCPDIRPRSPASALFSTLRRAVFLGPSTGACRSMTTARPLECVRHWQTRTRRSRSEPRYTASSCRRLRKRSRGRLCRGQRGVHRGEARGSRITRRGRRARRLLGRLRLAGGLTKGSADVPTRLGFESRRTVWPLRDPCSLRVRSRLDAAEKTNCIAHGGPEPLHEAPHAPCRERRESTGRRHSG
jgi:hypothetical protein